MNALRLLLAIALLPACGPHPPDRPQGVPTSAVWAGGADGGAWIDCTAEIGTPTNECTVYQETTGEPLAKGPFVLRGSGSAASAEQLRYSAFDGRSIYLQDGEVLDPAEQRLPHVLTLADGIAPPRLLDKVVPHVPARLREFTGTLVFEVTVDQEGSVRDVHATQDSTPAPAELEEACRSAILQWRYEPPMHLGHAVVVRIPVTIMFRLP